MVLTLTYLHCPYALLHLDLLVLLLVLFSNLFLKLEPAAMLRNATYVAIAFFLGSLHMLYISYMDY